MGKRVMVINVPGKGGRPKWRWTNTLNIIKHDLTEKDLSQER